MLHGSLLNIYETRLKSSLKSSLGVEFFLKVTLGVENNLGNAQRPSLDHSVDGDPDPQNPRPPMSCASLFFPPHNSFPPSPRTWRSPPRPWPRLLSPRPVPTAAPASRPSASHRRLPGTRLFRLPPHRLSPPSPHPPASNPSPEFVTTIQFGVSLIPDVWLCVAFDPLLSDRLVESLLSMRVEFVRVWD